MGWHGHARALLLEEKTERKYSDIELLKRMAKIVAPYKWHLVLILVLSLARIGASILLPYASKMVFDSLAAGDLEGLKYACFFLLGAAVAFAVLRGLYIYAISWLGQRVIFDLRMKMFKKLSVMRLKYFSENPSGTIVSRLTNDVDALGYVAATGVLDIAADVASIVGALVMMLKLNFKLSLAVLLFLPVVGLVTHLLASRARRAYRITRKKIAEVTSKLAQDITGVKVVQAFSYRRDVNIREFEQVTREHMQANIEAVRSLSMMGPALSSLRAVGIALVLWYGGSLAAAGEATIGTIMAFLGYLDMFYRPLFMLSNFYGTLQGALAAAERIFEFLEEPSEDLDKGIELPEVKGEIVFDNVVFGYEENQPVIKGVSFKINPGEVVAIVGPTGSGKTTLINLLLKFYEPWSGRILLDGVDLKEIKTRWLRNIIGVVPQEPVLFNGTVLDNIKVAKPDATREEVEKVIAQLGLEEFVKELPKGLDTLIREGGKNLSVGQRQLISLARAFLADPRILVLDEAMSSVDAATEFKIRRAIERLLKGRTSIIIAHRLSMARTADKIIVVHNGKIVEEGSHEELLKKKGLYAKLYALQVAKAE